MFRLSRQFLRYLGGVRGTIALGLLAMTLSSLLAGANIGLIYPFFEGVFLRPAVEGAAAADAGWLASLGTLSGDLWGALHAGGDLKATAGAAFDAFLGRHGRLDVLLLLCALTVALATAKVNSLYLYRICFVHVEQTLVRELRNDLFRQVQEQSIDFLQRYRQGELISRLVNDVMVVRSLTITKVADLLMNLLQSLTYFGLALLIDWKLTLLSVLVLAPAVAGFQIVGQRLRKYSRRAQEHISRVTDRLSENLQGFRVVQAFFARERERERFEEATASYFRRVRKLEFVSAFSAPFAEWASTLVAVFMLWYGGTRILSAESSLGASAFLTFLAALLAMLHPLKIVARSWNELQKGSGAGDRLLEVLAETPSIVETPGARPVDGFREALVFEGVGFAYGDATVLRDVDLRVERGEVVALVGGSGSGKTTLANLALRLLDPTAGRLLLDGADYRELRLGDLRRVFGVVGQDTWLFQMTVAENVGYPGREPDRERVLEALATANALDFVERMGGPDAVVTEGGGNLSGGQRQRLAIARAVYRHPDVLVFDEATSALDTESEQQVQEALDRSIGERTALVIAHRLSTVIRADRIVCLKDGRVDGVGPHKELLETSAEYRKLYELQFRV